MAPCGAHSQHVCCGSPGQGFVAWSRANRSSPCDGRSSDRYGEMREGGNEQTVCVASGDFRGHGEPDFFRADRPVPALTRVRAVPMLMPRTHRA